jgi:hypothetical protein
VSQAEQLILWNGKRVRRCKPIEIYVRANQQAHHYTHRDTETHRHTQRHTHTHRHIHTHTDTHRHTSTHTSTHVPLSNSISTMQCARILAITGQVALLLAINTSPNSSREGFLMAEITAENRDKWSFQGVMVMSPAFPAYSYSAYRGQGRTV